MNYKGNHPWGVFLSARANCIDWLKDHQKRNDEQIAYDLSMDSEQVYLIRTRNRNLENMEEKE